MTSKPANRLDTLTSQERQAATEFVSQVYQQFGDNVQTILLFGSRARGEAAPDSDMDLLVVVSDASPDIVRAIRYLAVDVWLKYDIYLSTRVWSQKHWQQLGNLQTLLYRNILRDGVPL
jgi:predicted nucleotidyltransferase